MRSANLFGPLKGLCPHKALIGLTQASGLAGGFDFQSRVRLEVLSFSKLTDNKGLVDPCDSPPLYFTIAISLCSENPATLNHGIQYTYHYLIIDLFKQ